MGNILRRLVKCIVAIPQVTTYLEYRTILPDGALCVSHYTRFKVSNRLLEKVCHLSGAACFRFYDIYSTELTVDQDRIVMKSEEHNISPTYFIGGKLLSEEDISRRYPLAPAGQQLIEVRNKVVALYFNIGDQQLDAYFDFHNSPIRSKQAIAHYDAPPAQWR
ncbi:MAG: hypothetical protein M3Q81_04075 [bacterium]|nr:hypothetical protein [bacterium]